MIPNPALPPEGPSAAALTHDTKWTESEENWVAGLGSGRRVGPQLAPRPCIPKQGPGCAGRGPKGHTERPGLYPGAGGTARGVPQEDEWGAGAGEVRGFQDEGASGEAMEGEQNMERWEEKRGSWLCCCYMGETPEASGVVPAFGAHSSYTHTSACASHGFQSYSPK